MKEKENLETAWQKLKEIINELNKDENINVDTLIEKFREGTYLVKVCYEQLKKAENEFKKIKDDLDAFFQSEDKDKNYEDL